MWVEEEEASGALMGGSGEAPKHTFVRVFFSGGEMGGLRLGMFHGSFCPASFSF